jgi:hypothetical protein
MPALELFGFSALQAAGLAVYCDPGRAGARVPA